MEIRLSGGATVRITKVNDVLKLGRWLKEKPESGALFVLGHDKAFRKVLLR